MGDAVRLTPKGLPVIDGVIDYVQPGEDFLAVRTADGLYRFHSLERIGVSIAVGTISIQRVAPISMSIRTLLRRLGRTG